MAVQGHVEHSFIFLFDSYNIDIIIFNENVRCSSYRRHGYRAGELFESNPLSVPVADTEFFFDIDILYFADSFDIVKKNIFLKK